MSIERIKAKNFKEKIENEKGLVIMKFSADWCAPCKIITPHLEKLIQDYNGKIKVYEIDVEDEENSELVVKYDITNLPTMIVFKDGKILTSIVGVLNYNSLKKEIELYFN